MMYLQNSDTKCLVKIISIEGGESITMRLSQMGITPGAFAQVIRKAPFGWPVLIEINGLEIALSSKIASKVMVEVA